MKKTIYLHVGYHKTSTTFLQWKVFPQLEEVKLIRKTHAKKLFRQIRVRNLTEKDILRLRKAFDKKGTDGKPTLISYEGFTGSPFSNKKLKSAYTILDDLRRIFPEDMYDVRIIVGIRKQVDILTSLYIEFLHQGGTLKETDFFDRLNEQGKLHNYLYNDYLDYVEKVFGKFFVFIYENFKEDKESYLLELLDYVGAYAIPEYNNERLNRSYGKLQAKIARQLNKLFKSHANPYGKIPNINIKLKRRYSRKIIEKLMGKPKKSISITPRTLLKNNLSFKIHYKRYRLSDKLRNEIINYYKGDNLKLAQREDIDLPEYYHQT